MPQRPFFHLTIKYLIMTKTTAWSLFWILLFVVAGVIIYKYADRALDPTTSSFKWGLGPTTVEPFDMCFTVGEEGGEPVLAPCRGETSVMNIETGGASGSIAAGAGRADVLAGTGSAARAAAQLADGGSSGDGPTATQSQTSALGETGGLDGVEVSGLGARSLDDGNVGVGQATGEGGGALWEGRRGDEAGTGDLSGICGDNEYTIGDMCCAKHLLPKDAVYGEAASSCSDWSCKHGYVRGASSVQCVVAGSTSAAVIAGDSPPLDAIGIIDGLPTSSSTVTIRVDSGSDAELGDGHVTVSGAGTDGTSISRTGRKKAARVFDFGPFNLDDITNDGSIEYDVVVPFNIIAPRADNTINLSFSYCNPDAYYKDDVDGTCKLASECGTTGFFTPGVSGGFGTCTLYTDCDSAPVRQQEVAGGTTDRVCCPPLEAESGWRYPAGNLDPSCVQVCSTGALTNLGACPASAAAAPVCGPGLQLPSADDADGKRWYGDATSTVWDVSHGLAQTCTPCTAKPADAEWSGTSGCEWNCTGATWKSGSRCAAYNAASGCGTQNSENRVRVLNSDNVACCQPTPQGEGAKWAEPASSLTGITLSAGVMGKQGTGACNISCEDDYYSVGSGRCERYTAATSTLPGCDVTVGSDGVTYKRVKSDGQNYVCCDNKGVGEEWQEPDFWTGTNQVDLSGGDVKGVLDMCETECAPGNWLDSSTGTCKPYTAVTATGAPNCDTWSTEANAAPVYRASAGGDDENIVCCAGLGPNEAWRYDASGAVVVDPNTQVWGDVINAVTLNTQTPAERVNRTYSYDAGVRGGSNIGCQKICEKGYYREAGGACVPRGQHSDSNTRYTCMGEECCGLQMDASGWTATSDWLRLTGWQPGEGTGLKCCAPLADNTKWTYGIPGWAERDGGAVGSVDESGQVADISYAYPFGNSCESTCADGWHQTGWVATEVASAAQKGEGYKTPTCAEDLDAGVACDGSACPIGNTDCTPDPRTYWNKLWVPSVGNVNYEKCCNAGTDGPFNTPTGEYWTNWRWRHGKTDADDHSRDSHNTYYRKTDCSYVQLPDNASWSSGGKVDGGQWQEPVWECNTGYWNDGNSCQPISVCDASGGAAAAAGATNSPPGTFYEPVEDAQGVRNRICCPDLKTPFNIAYTPAQQSSLSHLYYANPATNDGGQCKLECDGDYYVTFTNFGYPYCKELGSLSDDGLCATPGTCQPEGTCGNGAGGGRQSKLVGVGDSVRYAVLGDSTSYTDDSSGVTWQQAKRNMRNTNYWRNWTTPVTHQSSTGWNPYQMVGQTPHISPFGDGISDVSDVRHCVACDATMFGVASGTRVTVGNDWKAECSLACNAGYYQPVGGGACQTCVQGVYPSFNAAAGFPQVCLKSASGRFLVLGMIEHDATSAGFNFLPVNTMLAPWDLVMKISMQQGDGVLAWTRSNGQRLPDDTAVPRNGTYARLMSGSGVKAISTQKYMQSNWWNRTFAMGACYESTASTTRGSIVFGNVYRRWLHTSGNGQVPFAPGGVNSALDQWNFGPAEMTDTDITTNDAKVEQAAKHAWVITYVDGDGVFNPVNGLPRLYKDNKKRGGALTAAWQWVVGTTFVMGVDNPIVSSATPGTDLARWSQAVDTNGAWGFPDGYYLPTDKWVTAQNTTCPDGANCTVQSGGGTTNLIWQGDCGAGKRVGWNGCCECLCRERTGGGVGEASVCLGFTQQHCADNLNVSWPADGANDNDCQVYTQDGQAHIGTVGLLVECAGNPSSSVEGGSPINGNCNGCGGVMDSYWGFTGAVSGAANWVYSNTADKGAARLKEICQATDGCTAATLIPHVPNDSATSGFHGGILWSGEGARCGQPGSEQAGAPSGATTIAFVNDRVRANESTYTQGSIPWTEQEAVVDATFSNVALPYGCYIDQATGRAVCH